MTNPQGDPTREQLEEFVLGLVTPADADAMEARLAADAALAAEVAALRDTLAAMALSTPVAPDQALKQRVMAKVSATTTTAVVDDGGVLPLTPRSRSTMWLGFALAASLGLVVKLSFDLRAARRASVDAVERLATREAAIAHRDSLLATLGDPGMELVDLAATGKTKPMLRAYIDHRRHLMTLTAAALEPMPAGRVYQLWFIMDGKQVPSVTFTPGPDGRAMVENVPMPGGAIAATAITAEPEGGSPAPTTTALYMGKLGEK